MQPSRVRPAQRDQPVLPRLAGGEVGVAGEVGHRDVALLREGAIDPFGLGKAQVACASSQKMRVT
jgi:hypothetical protein